MVCVKIPIHLKFTWTKKIRGCAMHCRHSGRKKILPLVIEPMQFNKADNYGGFLRVVRGIQRVLRGIDPSDCWNLSKRGFKDYKLKVSFTGGFSGLVQEIFVLPCLQEVCFARFFPQCLRESSSIPISICTEDCIFVYFLFAWIFTGTIYIINLLCKNPDTFKIDKNKKIEDV